MSKQVKIGNLFIGGDNKILIQSMTSVKTSNVEETVNQIKRLEEVGCDIVRVAVRDEVDALSIKSVKDKVKVPIVADIHFDYKLAIKSIENGADKVRINPGNIGSEDKIKMVAYFYLF